MAEEETGGELSQPPKQRMDRRTFVRRTVNTAAVGAIGATGIGLGLPLSTTLGIKIPRFPYLGVQKVGGPAPKGIPLIPVRVDEEGYINGVPDRLEWYKYCSHEGAPGLLPGFTDDNRFYYFQNQEKIHFARSQGIDVWYEDRLDQPLHIDHFDEVGKGAPFKWRSKGQVDTNIVTGIAVKIDPSKVEGKTEELEQFVNVEHGIMAVCSFCAHFCCVPGYADSAQAKTLGVFDKLFCTCHGSIYDLYKLKEYQFPPNRSF